MTRRDIRLFSLSLQTTGLEEQDDIIEWAAAYTLGDDVRECDVLVRSARRSDPDALRCHGITAERLAAEGVPRDEGMSLLHSLLRRRASEGYWLVCANLAFAMPMLRANLVRAGFDPDDVASTLDALRGFDVIAADRLLREDTQGMGRSLPALAAAWSTPTQPTRRASDKARVQLELAAVQRRAFTVGDDRLLAMLDAERERMER